MTSKEFVNKISQQIRNNNLEEAEALIEECKEIISTPTSAGKTILHDAVSCNLFELTDKLINMGIDINIESRAFGLAINLSKNVEMAEYLLSKGLKINMSLDLADMKNPVLISAKYNKTEMFKYWMDKELELIKEETVKEELISKALEIATMCACRGIVEIIERNYREVQPENETVLEEFDFEKYKIKMLDVIKRALLRELSNCTEHIYGLCLYGDAHLSGTTVVLNTIENLERNNDNEEAYFKYCVEEWDIWSEEDTLGVSLSKEVSGYLELLKNRDNYDEFRDKIFDIHISILKELRENKFIELHFGESILLLYYIREYFSQEEVINIAKILNSGELLEDYITHIDEFY